MNAYCCIVAKGVGACHLAAELEIDVPNTGLRTSNCSKNLPHRCLLNAYTLTRLYAYTLIRLHAYMFTRLYVYTLTPGLLSSSPASPHLVDCWLPGSKDSRPHRPASPPQDTPRPRRSSRQGSHRQDQDFDVAQIVIL